jgi:phosphatidylglycerol lysyltransferase
LNPPLVAALVFVLLPQAEGLDYLTWLELFLLGQLLAMASHVPGGFGVLESGVVVLVGPYLAPPEVAGALLVYRGLYTLLPLAAAVVALGAHEWRRRPGGTLRP